MGTFHTGKHALHGITVVVETEGPETYVGRCDDMDDAKVILLDVDVHRDGVDDTTKAAWLSRVAAYGGWAKHAQLVVDRQQVTSVRRLGEIEA